MALTLVGRTKKLHRLLVIVVSAEGFLSLDRQRKGQQDIELVPRTCQGPGGTADCVQRWLIRLLCSYNGELGQFHSQWRTPEHRRDF